MAGVFLRAFELDDSERINQWRADKEIMGLTAGGERFVSLARERQWVQDKCLNDQMDIYLAICLIDDREMIGFISLNNLDWRNRSVELGGVLIGRKELWNKGLSTDAGTLILEHAFGELNLHRVYAHILKENTASLRLFERLNFKQEGVQRESVYKNHTYHDLIVVSILRQEYYSNHQAP